MISCPKCGAKISLPEIFFRYRASGLICKKCNSRIIFNFRETNVYAFLILVLNTIYILLALIYKMPKISGLLLGLLNIIIGMLAIKAVLKSLKSAKN
jgi:DNA-directed RNA polymerase subunit RPC12/RpoP